MILFKELRDHTDVTLCSENIKTSIFFALLAAATMDLIISVIPQEKPFFPERKLSTSFLEWKHPPSALPGTHVKLVCFKKVSSEHICAGGQVSNH